MLDAAEVTTNFQAGGKLAKFMNRNGCTFLNASIQGAVQQFRNIGDAKRAGIKGWAGLAAKFLVAGVAPNILNHLVWGDDEDYEELPDYVKNNYYIPFKYGDGQFVRLPKGRTAAVLQDLIEQVAKQSMGDDTADWETFGDLVIENLAPNNPVTDNIFAPIIQVAKNEAWYGDDIVPYRLQDLPAAEQFDEKTDALSIWLGEKLDYSPKKINYLIDQYSGGYGDTLLPYFTPKAESPTDSKFLQAFAPFRDRFTTDSVLNNRVTGDFYETLEAAEAQAESPDATMEDKLRSNILIGYNVEISKLYAQQREVQTSDMKDSEKYKRNREIKEEINALQEQGLAALDDYSYDGIYAEAGDKRYNYDAEDDTWWEVKPTLADGSENWYYLQEQLHHNELGVSYSDYWNGNYDPAKDGVKTHYAEMNGKRYNYDEEDGVWYEIQEKNKDGSENWYYTQEQLFHNNLGVDYADYWNGEFDPAKDGVETYYAEMNGKRYNYDINDNVWYEITPTQKDGSENWYYTQEQEITKESGMSYSDYWNHYFNKATTGTSVFGNERYTEYAKTLGSIKADKDEYGNAISGTRYPKVKEYINSLDIPDIEKKILMKMQYPNSRGSDYQIVKYLDSNDAISNTAFLEIMDELGYKVDNKGYITWW